jgi:hypothetical protein
MRDESAHLHEGAWVEEQVDALPGGELACLMLFLDALRAASFEGTPIHFVEAGDGSARRFRGSRHFGGG